MTTAEKRAQLIRAGAPWPDCECHAEAMLWQKRDDLDAGGYFRCRVRVNTIRRRIRNQHRQADSCIHCGGVLATETMCRRCADRHADAMAKPKQKMLHQLAQVRHRGRLRAGKGFQPTGVGMAAFAAWKDKQPGS